MPFTIAHPAASIPLRRRLGRAGVLPALILGSMMPDLPYFVPIPISGRQSHSPAGLIGFCVPFGILLVAIWQKLVSPLAAALLPQGVRARLSSTPPVERRRVRVAATAISLLVGAVTHVVWDAFTHSSGFVVERFAPLRAPIAWIGAHPIRMFSLLQHGSTLLGIALMTLWARRWYLRTSPDPECRAAPLPDAHRLAYLLALTLPAGVAGISALAAPVRHASEVARITAEAVHAVCAAGGVFLLAVGASAAFFRWRARARATAVDDPQAA